MKEKNSYNQELMISLSALLMLALMYLSWNLPTDEVMVDLTPYFSTPTPEE